MENDLAGLSINEGEEEAWQFHDGSDMQPELFDLCLISDLGEMGYLFRFYNRVDIDRVVDLSNPDATSYSPSSSSSLYPSLDMKDLAENLFPDDATALHTHQDSAEQLLLKVPGAIVHLVERETSVELACGDLCIVSLLQGDNVVAVFARL
ncbi:hypothetical protein Golob_007275, partial [Gossypium lobatum]|nr:hypothetical protein [Gossypium lobatum]